MPFLSFNNADIEFAELGKLTWRSYTTTEALATTIGMELIDKREFVKAAMNENSEILVIHISVLDVAELSIYLFQTA